MKAGDDLNHPNLAGFLPLHQAAKQGCVDLVSFLLEHDADPELGSVDNIKPADLSIAFGHPEITGLLDNTVH